MAEQDDAYPELDADIAVFLRHLTSGPALPLSDAPEALQALRRESARLRQPLNAGGPTMRISQGARLSSNGRSLGLVLHVPERRQGLGALLYLHGGGWTILSTAVYDRVMRELAAATGMIVLGLDYSLAPERPFPAALDDCLATVAALRAQTPECGIEGLEHFEIDPTRLALAGDSAGANLALATTLALRDRGKPLPQALLLCYGAYDPEMSSESHRQYSDGRYLLSGKKLAWFWDNYEPRVENRQHPYISPFHAELSGLPPSYFLIAEHDILRDENVALANLLKNAGGSVAVDCVPRTIHAFIEACGCAELSRLALHRGATFLVKQIG